MAEKKVVAAKRIDHYTDKIVADVFVYCIYVWIYENGTETLKLAPWAGVFFSPQVTI